MEQAEYGTIQYVTSIDSSRGWHFCVVLRCTHVLWFYLIKRSTGGFNVIVQSQKAHFDPTFFIPLVLGPLNSLMMIVW